MKVLSIKWINLSGFTELPSYNDKTVQVSLDFTNNMETSKSSSGRSAKTSYVNSISLAVKVVIKDSFIKAFLRLFKISTYENKDPFDKKVI